MRPWMALPALGLVAACGFSSSPGTGSGSGSNMIDASVDGTRDAAQLCFGSFVPVCFAAAVNVPTAAVPLDDVNVDTGDMNMCNQHNDKAESYCVIAGSDLVLGAGKKLRAFGSKPLILLSTTTFQIQGTIDVASYRTAMPPVTGQAAGAGANPAALCTGGADAQGAGGGFGGSFGGKGGNGEQVDSSTGGTAAGTTSTTALRGGCPGGAGAMMAGTGGAGGAGGGAVAVIATTIALDGAIDASGAGGRGGAVVKAGAGGGGSGGMIVLDTMTIMGSGMLYANGGSGAQGGPTGADGAESTAPASFAAGGKNPAPGTDGGQGGDGSAGSKPNGGSGTNAQSQGGGGGGGGGAGIIRAAGVTTNISPPSSL